MFKTKKQLEDSIEEEFEEDEIEEALLTGVENPQFPIIIMLIAFTKDSTDVATLGLFGWLGMFILGFVIWFWILGKVGFVRKRLMKYVIRRYIVALILGLIPILNFSPEAMVLVLLVHYREKKIVKLFFDALERMNIKA